MHVRSLCSLHSTSIALALLKNRISLAGKLAGAAVQYLENVYDCPLVTQSDHINAPNSALETEHHVVEGPWQGAPKPDAKGGFPMALGM